MKKTLPLLLLLLSASAWAQQPVAPSRPTVGVVLSGGGAKGVAHISALRAIEEAGIPIDIITGTSMGALIGGLYSAGWTTDQLDSLVRSQDWLFLLTDRVSPADLDIENRLLQDTYPLWHAFPKGASGNEGAGVIRGDNLDHLFDRLLYAYPDSICFDSLPIRFACVATDIVTNTEVDFHSGSLKLAMRSSMSIPGVFSPVRMGNMLLVDGGMRNNYPSDIARQMGADIIIGVSVQGDTLTANDISTPFDLLMQIIDVNCKNKYDENVRNSDIFMKVDVSGYSSASFTATSVDTLLQRGATAAAQHRAHLLDISSRINGGVPAPPVTRPTMLVEQPSSPRLKSIPQVLTFPVVGVTFRVDNEENSALQIGARYPFYWLSPMEVSMRLRLGKRLVIHFEHRFYPRGISSPSLSYEYQHNDIDIYESGSRKYNIKSNRHIVELTPINSTFKKYRLRIGLRFDYHNYYDNILSASQTAIDVSDQHFFSYFFESLLNNEDHLYFPTSGTHFILRAAYHTDNFATYEGTTGIPEVIMRLRVNLSPWKHITFQPSMFSRLLFGDKMPLSLIGALGSRQQMVDGQLYFPGIRSIVMTDRYIIGASLRTQLRIADKHHVLLDGAAARQLDDIKDYYHSFDLGSSDFTYGVSLGYAYTSYLGNIEAYIGYSSLAPSATFYLALGHAF